MLAGPVLRLLGPRLDRLRDADGIQWPVTETAPDGTERLCADGRFPTDPEVCEDYGHDLATRAEQSPRGVPGQAAGRPCLPAGARLPAGGRAARRGVPAAADHRPQRLPLPHPDQDRPGARAPGGRPRGLGRAVGRRRRAPGRGRRRPGPGWRRAGARSRSPAGHRDQRGHGVRALPRRPPGGQRADPDRWDPVSKQPLYKTAAVRLSREG
jgi:hypothetical protein